MPDRDDRDDRDDRELLEQALCSDAQAHAALRAMRQLVARLLPVIQARIARILVRRRGGSGRDARQEVEDIAQEVFLALFANDGKVLRAWDPSRGLSLASFCGLIAERQATSILRSGRRSPWTEAATELDDLEKVLAEVPDSEVRIASREQLERLVDSLRQSLSPRGLELFYRLVVDEESVESVCASTGMTADAAYAWKSRIGKIIRKLAGEMAASQPKVPAENARSARPMSEAAVSARRSDGGAPGDASDDRDEQGSTRETA